MIICAIIFWNLCNQESGKRFFQSSPISWLTKKEIKDENKDC